MKAVRIHEDGGPEVLRYEDAPDPVAGPGEVLIGLRAASLNHLDVWLRRGLPSAPKPRILGADGAGVVVALGEGVDRFREGDEVVINPGLDEGARIVGEHMDGTHAELIALPADYIYPLPDGLTFEQAAAFPLVFETAYRMLVTRAGLQEGEWVFVWGIGGGVGHGGDADRQGARRAGHRDLVQRREARAGARARRRRDRQPRRGATSPRRCARRPAATARTSSSSTSASRPGRPRSRSLRRAGGSTVCGATSGPNPPANLHRIWWKQLTVLGSTMGTQADFQAVYELVAAGRAQPVVDRAFPLAEAAAAHEHLESGRQLGKVVLTIPG